MIGFVLALGALTMAAGLFGVAQPQRLAGMAAGVAITEGLRLLAAWLRFAAAIALFFAAYQTRFSLALQALAMLIALSGIVPLAVGRATLQRWFEAVAAWPAAALRGIAAAALALGALLVAAAL